MLRHQRLNASNVHNWIAASGLVDGVVAVRRAASHAMFDTSAIECRYSDIRDTDGSGLCAQTPASECPGIKTMPERGVSPCVRSARSLGDPSAAFWARRVNNRALTT